MIRTPVRMSNYLFVAINGKYQSELSSGFHLIHTLLYLFLIPYRLLEFIYFFLFLVGCNVGVDLN